MNIIQDFIPKGRRNRPGRVNPMKFITIHNTGNTSKGAGAKNHAAYEEILNFIFNSSSGILLAAASVGTLLMLIISHSHAKISVYSKERLELVVSPLFRLLEPYMRGQKCNLSIIADECVKIINNNLLIAGGHLMEFKEQLLIADKIKDKKHLSRLFNQFSRHIDREYDRYSRKFGLPLRRQIYKLNTYITLEVESRNYSSVFPAEGREIQKQPFLYLGAGVINTLL